MKKIARIMLRPVFWLGRMIERVLMRIENDPEQQAL